MDRYSSVLLIAFFSLLFPALFGTSLLVENMKKSAEQIKNKPSKCNIDSKLVMGLHKRFGEDFREDFKEQMFRLFSLYLNDTLHEKSCKESSDRSNILKAKDKRIKDYLTQANFETEDTCTNSYTTWNPEELMVKRSEMTQYDPTSVENTFGGKKISEVKQTVQSKERKKQQREKEQEQCKELLGRPIEERDPICISLRKILNEKTIDDYRLFEKDDMAVTNYTTFMKEGKKYATIRSKRITEKVLPLLKDQLDKNKKDVTQYVRILLELKLDLKDMLPKILDKLYPDRNEEKRETTRDRVKKLVPLLESMLTNGAKRDLSKLLPNLFPIVTELGLDFKKLLLEIPKALKSKSKKAWLPILADLFALDEIKTLDLNAVELKKVVSVLNIVLDKMLDEYSVLDILSLSKPILRKFLQKFWGEN